MSRENGQKGVAKEYPNTQEFNQDTKKVFSGEPTGMYDRYDYKELASQEKNLAEMIGVPDTAIFNSGMSAVHTAIEAEGLKPGDVVLCSHDVYGVTKDYVASLKERGIVVKFFDPSDTEVLKNKSHEFKPRLIIAETVSNSEEMKVVDIQAYAELVGTTNDEYQELTIEKCLDRNLSLKKVTKEMPESFKQKFLQAFIEYEKDNKDSAFHEVRQDIVDETGISKKEATDLIVRVVKYVRSQRRDKLSLIVDNTLPSPVLINPIEQVGEITDEMTVVESGTKHYQGGKNKITLGVAYSKDPDRIKKMKDLRVQTGGYLQAEAEKEIPEDTSVLMQENLKNHARNALTLANVLEQNGFIVHHPNLKSHKQSELANKMAPDGAVTLFYADLPENISDRDEFMDRVKKIGGDAIGLGSSFGHEKTWLSNFALGDNTIRIAVGMESSEDFSYVIDSFKNAVEG